MYLQLLGLFVATIFNGLDVFDHVEVWDGNLRVVCGIGNTFSLGLCINEYFRVLNATRNIVDLDSLDIPGLQLGTL